MTQMMSQTSAFVTRSVRQESRLLSHHLTRCGMVTMMLFLLIIQLSGSNRMSAAGLTLVDQVLDCCYWCLTLLGITYFGVSITEEKEEETLPLLRMTGVRDLTLLLGKSLPRLLVVVLLILVASPFLMLAVTLGGVLKEQIIASFLGILCYTFCLSQVGLLASTICPVSTRAVSLTTLIWLFLEFGSWLLWLAALACNERQYYLLGEWLSGLSAEWWNCTMWDATGNYLLIERGESILHRQMLFHLIVGGVCFGLSWLLFDRFNRNAIAGAAAAMRGPVVRLQKSDRSVPRRSWNDALAWKSWVLIGGGTFWFWFWMVGLPVLSVVLVLVICAIVGERVESEPIGIVLMITGVAAMAISLSRLFGNVLSREVQQQTLVSLFLLPRSTGAVLRHTVYGLLPFLLIPLNCFLVGFLLLSFTEPRFFSDFMEGVLEPWTWAFVGWAIVTVNLGMLLSVCFRHGGMLIAIALCWFISPFVIGMLISVIAFAIAPGPSGTEFFRYVIPIGGIGIELFVCFILCRLVVRRIEDLASR